MKSNIRYAVVVTYADGVEDRIECESNKKKAKALYRMLKKKEVKTVYLVGSDLVFTDIVLKRYERKKKK